MRTIARSLFLAIAVCLLIVPEAEASAGWCRPDTVAREDRHPLQPLTVTYFGTSTLLFSDGRDRVLIDGFFSRPRLGTLLTSALVPDDDAIAQGMGTNQPPLRAVLVAHAHHDHAMDVAAIVRTRPEAVVIGTRTVRRLLRNQHIAPHRLCGGSERTPLSFGAFRVWAYKVQHGPSPAPLRWLLDRPLGRDFSEPAWFGAYRDHENLSFLIEHEGRKILVHPSAGLRNLAGLGAEVVFLGLAGVGTMSEADATGYFNAVLGPRTKRVVPIHWDRFTTPLGEPLQPIPWPLDNVPRGFSLLCEHKTIRRAHLVTRMDAGSILLVWDAEPSTEACDPPRT